MDDAGVITVPPAAEAEVVEVCAEAWLESERRRVRDARKRDRSSIMRLLGKTVGGFGEDGIR